VHATTRTLTALAAGATVLALSATLAAQAAPPRAQTAHTLSIKDEAHLHYVHSSGSTLSDEGNATGTIPGKVRINFTYNGNPNVSAQFTIYAKSGSLKVRAGGKLSSPTNPTPSFSGALSVTGGSGRYAHAHGTGHLYGVYYRHTYAMLVQTEGHIQY
jgi:hypothetical protein